MANVSGKVSVPLETYEWEDVWWDHADDDTKPRLLIVGDSISCGYRSHAIGALLKEGFEADSYGSSKGIDNPYLVASIQFFVQRMARCDAFVFNNGLHGWHLSTAEYRKHYERVLRELIALYPGKPWLLALSTPTRRPEELDRFDERNALVLERNGEVRAIAEAFGLPVIDYYSLLCDHPEWWSGDGVHLNTQGYQQMGEFCARAVSPVLRQVKL